MNVFSLIGRSQKRWNQNIFSTSLSKSAPRASVSYDFWVKSRSRYSLAHIFSTSSSKSAPCPSVILRCSSGNRALATVLCAFCRQLCPIEPRTRGNRDPLLRRPRQPLYRKKTQGFAPESVFKPEFRRSRSTTWWWCCCHDDVVDRMIDMMMWLPWWWESWPWQSSVTRKFPN